MSLAQFIERTAEESKDKYKSTPPRQYILGRDQRNLGHVRRVTVDNRRDAITSLIENHPRSTQPHIDAR
jgi:hypothetical protein